MALFKYPVQITASEIKTELGIDLSEEYGNRFNGFLNDVHSSIYEGGIYATGDKDIKDRIIKKHKNIIENAIKRASIFQASYIHETGSIGTESGITITGDGQKAVVNKYDLRSKNICIAALDALKACSIPLLYAGED